METSEKKIEHGTGHAVEYSGCHCIECEAMKEAVQDFIGTLSYIPHDWVQKLQEPLGEHFAMPMWGTLWLAGDNQGCIEDLMEKSKPSDEKWEKLQKESDEGDENAQMQIDGWVELADTGVYAREFEGEILLGINGAGYSFKAEHFFPLYKALGFSWHEGSKAKLLMEKSHEPLLEAAKTAFERLKPKGDIKKDYEGHVAVSLLSTAIAKAEGKIE